jgi:hypothetical protein
MTTTMQTDDSVDRKWCPLCEELKAATVMAAPLEDAGLIESAREITYCQNCGAKLLDEPQ